MSENKIYISRMYMTASHLCLCGCGHLSVTPLCGNNWVFEYHNNKLSMQPSILNNNCPNKSHYIITKNKANFIGGVLGTHALFCLFRRFG